MKEEEVQWMDQKLLIKHISRENIFEYIVGDLAYWCGYPTLAHAAHSKMVAKILKVRYICFQNETVSFDDINAKFSGIERGFDELK